MNDPHSREEFDTGISKIRNEIKSRLVPHGLFGTVTNVDSGTPEEVTGSSIHIVAKGRTASRSFNRLEIESCRLRVGGTVLAEIMSMVDELAA
jgi:hypothetical protein